MSRNTITKQKTKAVENSTGIKKKVSKKAAAPVVAAPVAAPVVAEAAVPTSTENFFHNSLEKTIARNALKKEKAGAREAQKNEKADAREAQKKEKAEADAIAQTQTQTHYKKPTSDKSKKTNSRRRRENYSSYIYKVLKQVQPECGISKQTMSIMNSFINDMFERIVHDAGRLCRYNKKKTLTLREIQTAVRLVLPGGLKKYAVTEGIEAIKATNRFNDGITGDGDCDSS